MAHNTSINLNMERPPSYYPQQDSTYARGSYNDRSSVERVERVSYFVEPPRSSVVARSSVSGHPYYTLEGPQKSYMYGGSGGGGGSYRIEPAPRRSSYSGYSTQVWAAVVVPLVYVLMYACMLVIWMVFGHDDSFQSACLLHTGRLLVCLHDLVCVLMEYSIM
jgi:hypothetical protein